MGIKFYKNKAKTQQIKRSICQTVIPGIISVTESPLKRHAKLPKLVANKGNFANGLIKTLPINSVLDLLRVLGFDTDEINIYQLNKIMEREVANLEDEPQKALMKACLVLQTEELGNLRKSSKKLREENAKLRADNKDADSRISLLESKLKLFEQEGINIKTELELVRTENKEDLESEKQKMPKSIAEMPEKNIDLQIELTKVDETNHTKHRKQQFESTTIKKRNDSPTKTQWAVDKTKSDSQTEIENTRKIISDLEEELKKTEKQLNTLSPSTSATSSPEEFCKEPEASLEQILQAYEDFEDYWQAEQNSHLSPIEMVENHKKFNSQEIDALQSEIEDLRSLLSFNITDAYELKPENVVNTLNLTKTSSSANSPINPNKKTL